MITNTKSFTARCGVFLALLMAGSATPALAQTASQTDESTAPDTDQADEPDADDEIITVIGTRIPGLPTDGPVPTETITRQDIIESGAGTLIEVLEDLPVTTGGGQTFSTATAGALSSDTPVGASAVSLRGLGASATLTLINGSDDQSTQTFPK